MKRYSHFFSTLHDQTEAVGSLGRGTHYSILRAVILAPEPCFHDFAVIWDEDHDTRVIWVLEKMFAASLLHRAIVVGERKGGITVLTRYPPKSEYADAVHEIAQSVPTDSFVACVETLPEASEMIIHAENARVRAYLAGIDALWRLGPKPISYTTDPFDVE